MSIILQHLCLLFLTLPLTRTQLRLPYCITYESIEGFIRCTSCMPGYKLSQHQCSPCDKDNCDKQDYRFGGTKNAKISFAPSDFLQSADKQEVIADENLNEIKKNLSTKPKRLVDSFLKAYFQILASNPNCVERTANNICKKCRDGYNLTKNGSCLSTLTKSKLNNCAIYVQIEDKCFSCVNGFLPNQDGYCIKTKEEDENEKQQEQKVINLIHSSVQEGIKIIKQGEKTQGSGDQSGFKRSFVLKSINGDLPVLQKEKSLQKEIINKTKPQNITKASKQNESSQNLILSSYPYCAVYKNETCWECQIGYILNKIVEKCIKINTYLIHHKAQKIEKNNNFDINCLQISSNGEYCQKCRNRYFFDKEQKICKFISPFCKQWNEKGQCTLCYEDYDVEDGKCVMG